MFKHIINVKLVLCFSFIFFCLGCSSTKQIEISENNINPITEIDKINEQICYKKDISSVYIGISPRMENRKREIDYAKIHIANQIAMEEECIIDFGIVSIDNKNFFVDNSDSNIDYNDTNIVNIEESLEIIDIQHFDLLTIVIAKSKDISSYNSLQYFPNKSTPPDWINNIPNLSEEYYVNVGISGKHSSLYKSILVSDVNAAQQIAIEINSYLNSFSYDKIVSAIINGGKITDNNSISGTVLLSKANLYGFRIINRWIDPKTNYCYSLAIAKKNGGLK